MTNWRERQLILKTIVHILVTTIEVFAQLRHVTSPYLFEQL